MTTKPTEDELMVLYVAVHRGRIVTGADGFVKCLHHGYIEKTLNSPHKHRLSVTDLGRSVLAEHEGER